ncbi:MAG: hypothetical protein INF85_20685, partial [Roseomonas sp.]|nr:hypothetical protein [Roseomonas sp.]
LQRCLDTEGGARSIDHALENFVIPALSSAVLGRIAEGSAFDHAQVAFSAEGRLEIILEAVST